MSSFWSPYDVFSFLKEKNYKNHLVNTMPGRIVKAKQKTRSNNGRTRM